MTIQACWNKLTESCYNFWCCSKEQPTPTSAVARTNDVFERAIESRHLNQVTVHVGKHTVQKSTDVLTMQQFIEDTNGGSNG